VAWGDAEEARKWGAWIWFPEGVPKHAAPVEARYFRRTFEVPASDRQKRAKLTVAADDKFEAWVNGEKIGSGESWSSPRDFDVKKLLRPGQNVVAIRAENAPAPVKENPAGLMAVLEVELESGKKIWVLSDGEWRAAKGVGLGNEWTQVGLDDSHWPQALVTAQYGEGPWGRIGGGQPAVVPFAAGTGNRLLVVYAPDARSVRVSQLREGRQYRLTRFDPVSGEEEKLPAAESSEKGDLIISAPVYSHDWIVTLEVEK